MNAEKMTQKAMEALQAAHADAVRKGHPELTTLHLLQALLEQEHRLTGNLLGKMEETRCCNKRSTSRKPDLQWGIRKVAASGGMNQSWSVPMMSQTTRR